jgi:SAM-dependent methyltransferase
MSTSAQEMRFGFGKNWHRFVKRSFTEERLSLAQKHMLDFLGRPSLNGLDFLDIGCGSGLHSYGAFKAQARRVFSFDYDLNSVKATKSLREHANSPDSWEVEHGDVLSDAYIDKLGKWNLVYSWGVLHHTGQVWKAIVNAQRPVAAGGLFYIALYSADAQSKAEQEFWLAKKQEYNRLNAAGRQKMAAWYIWVYMMGKDWKKLPYVAKRLVEHRLTRGMSLMTDIHDWLGGWPMEYTHDQQVVDLLEKSHDFKLINVRTGQACTEFLFERTGAPREPTNVKQLEAKLQARREH